MWMRASKLLPVAILFVLGATLTAVVSSVQARTARVAEFELKPGPGFQVPGGVAIDQETGNIFVVDEFADSVYIFGKEGGAPAGGASAVISGLSFKRELTAPAGVAVDDACYFHVPRLSSESEECKKFDPSNGDVYIAETGAELLKKFRLNKLTHEYEAVQSFPFAALHGVAVDTQGNVYVADSGEQAITEFTREGGEVKITQGVIRKPAYIAVGAPGTVYLGGKGEEGYSGQGVVKLTVNGSNEGTPQSLGGVEVVSGGPIALEANGSALIDVENHVETYDHSGNLTGSFEFNTEKQILGGGGLAFDDETGQVAVANLVYGQSVAQPEPVIVPASAIGKATATLNGTVITEEEETEYHFEYGRCPGGAGSCEEAEYPLETIVEKIGPGGVGQALAVNATVSTLKPHTLYHFRLVAIAAKDGAPRLRSPEAIFETAPAVHGVGVCTAPPSGIEPHGATLDAPLEPLEGELPVEYRFEYGAHAPSRPSEPYEHQTASQRMTTVAEIGAVQAVLPGAGEMPLTPNTTYHCRLVGLSEGFEVPGEDNTFATGPAPPKVEAVDAAPGWTPRTAELLSGSVDPENSATSYYFAYVDKSDHDAPTVTPTLSAGAGGAPVPVGPVQITGLRAGTTYVYRLIAVNAAGEKAAGEEEMFTTAPATPPRVGSPQVSAITQTGATVAVAIDARELPTAYQFQLATTVTCSGATTSCTGAEAVYDGGDLYGTVPPGGEEVAIVLEHLASGTTYHLRALATDEDGISYGPDQTFTTLGVSSPIAEPIAPVQIATPEIAFPTEAHPQGPPTRVQMLHRALRTCRKKHSRKKTACERRARKLYGKG